jgi:ankyrin repeat protein
MHPVFIHCFVFFLPAMPYSNIVFCSVCEKILEKDKSALELTNENSQTPLHIAAQGGHDNVVALLLKNGASMEVRDQHSQIAIKNITIRLRQKVIIQIILKTAQYCTVDDLNTFCANCIKIRDLSSDLS